MKGGQKHFVVKVKICGITNLADAAVTAQAGADLLGFIFYERSPRYVTPEIVRTIINEQLGMNKAAPVFVGVFVNATIETIRQIMDFCRLDAAQLHGDEPPEFISQFQGRAYKALRPRSLVEAEALVVKYQPVLKPTSPPHLSLSESPPLPTHQSSLLPTFLFDAYHPGLYGGTGQVR